MCRSGPAFAAAYVTASLTSSRLNSVMSFCVRSISPARIVGPQKTESPIESLVASGPIARNRPIPPG